MALELQYRCYAFIRVHKWKSNTELFFILFKITGLHMRHYILCSHTEDEVHMQRAFRRLLQSKLRLKCIVTDCAQSSLAWLGSLLEQKQTQVSCLPGFSVRIFFLIPQGCGNDSKVIWKYFSKKWKNIATNFQTKPN